MGVDVVDLAGVDARILDRRLHGSEAAVAVLGGRGDVVGVAGQAVACDLGVDLRAARLGVLVLLEHQDARALAHDEAVAILVVRAAGLFRRVVEAGRHGPRGDEARHAHRADRRLCAARQHDVGVAVLDQPGRVADGVGAGRAGGDHRMVRPLESIADRNLAARQVYEGRGDEERAHPAGPLFVQLDRSPLDGGEPADARADHDPGPLAVLLGLRLPARVLHGLVGRGDGIEDEIVDPPLVAGGEGLVGIEGARDVRPAAAAAVHTRHLAGDLAGIVGRIEGGYPPDSGLAGQDGGPGDLGPLTQGGDQADTGDDDSTHASPQTGAVLKGRPPRPGWGPDPAVRKPLAESGA